MKKYVQLSRLDQCSLRVTNQEQYVDSGDSLVSHKPLKDGRIYNLTLWDCETHPTIALLYSSYLHYENVVIETILTTLHVGNVVFAIFPNYDVNLYDNTLSTRLKVHV